MPEAFSGGNSYGLVFAGSYIVSYAGMATGNFIRKLTENSRLKKRTCREIKYFIDNEKSGFISIGRMSDSAEAFLLDGE